MVFCGLTEWGVPPRWQVTAGSLRGIGRLLFRREEQVLSVARNTARVRGLDGGADSGDLCVLKRELLFQS